MLAVDLLAQSSDSWRFKESNPCSQEQEGQSWEGVHRTCNDRKKNKLEIKIFLKQKNRESEPTVLPLMMQLIKMLFSFSKEGSLRSCL